jgi:hypothetical protein
LKSDRQFQRKKCEKILNNDSQICRKYLLELFRDNDLEDLKYSFLEGHSFHINTTARNAPFLPSINGDTSSNSDVHFELIVRKNLGYSLTRCVFNDG